MNPDHYFFGDALALLTAITWAFAVIYYQKSSNQYSTQAIKIFHNGVAAVVFGLIAIIQSKTLWPRLSHFEWLLLISSAVLGITLGDTLYLASIKRIGAGTQALLDCLYSPIVIALALIFFDEQLSAQSLVGASLILSAILMSQRPEGVRALTISRREWGLGFLMGIGSQITMALCIIVIKDLLLRHDIALLTAHRYVIGTLCLAGLALVRGSSVNEMLAVFRFEKKILNSLWGCLLGPVIATWCWFAGYKYTLAGRAAIYNQLSTIFILILAYFWFGEKLTKRRQISVVMAVLGGLLVADG